MEDQARIHMMVSSEDLDQRCVAADLLGEKFFLFEDKEAAYQDLITLSQDDDGDVRFSATVSIGFAFQYIPDKAQAWEDLLILTDDRNGDVKSSAADSLGSALQFMPNKLQAWQNLLVLTQHQYPFVRWSAAKSLGYTFQYMPNKLNAWQDLIKLTYDEDRYVKCSAYYALGRAAVLKATEAENTEDMRAKLEEAIKFFGRSSDTTSEEGYYYELASFCLPFYRSLYSLLFTDISKDEEIQRYLAEAKKAVKGLACRESLLEAVDNLSRALLEVKTFTVMDIVLKKRDLKAYTRYCFQAADCLEKVRNRAPFACKLTDAIIVKKGIPIIDEKIKTMFEDVEDAARKLCKSSKGTILEDIGKSTYDSIRGLGEVSSPIAADRYLLEIVPLLKMFCNRLPKDAQAYLKVLVESQEFATLEQRYDALKSILLASLVQVGTDDKWAKEYDQILGILEGIEFNITRQSLSSGEMRLRLEDLIYRIGSLDIQLKTQGQNWDVLDTNLKERDQVLIERLEGMREKWLQSVEGIIQELPDKVEREKFLKEIQSLKPSNAREIRSAIVDLSSIAGMAFSIIPYLPH